LLVKQSVDGGSRETNPSIATDSCGNIYVSGHVFGPNAPTFYDADSDGSTLTNSSLFGKTTSGNNQVFVGKLKPTGKWEWAVSVDGGGNEQDPSIATDSCGNIYVSGHVSGSNAPIFYDTDSDGSTLTNSNLVGKPTSGISQVFIGKLTNDPRTNVIFGIVQQVDQTNNCALVEFGGVITTNETLVPGCPYYIDSYGPVHPNASKLTTEPCDSGGCNCPNRCIGVACDENSIIWNVEDPLCVKPKCCCCCQHLETNQQEF
jgi:hypothetical protein